MCRDSAASHRPSILSNLVVISKVLVVSADILFNAPQQITLNQPAGCLMAQCGLNLVVAVSRKAIQFPRVPECLLL